MRRAYKSLSTILTLLLILGLTQSPAFSDSLSIEAWVTGSALNATNLNSRMNSITTWSTNIANDNLKSSAGVVGSKLDLTSGTGRISHSTSVTSDAPIFTSAQTWDSMSTVFSAWRLTVTNTNSASTSRLIDLRVGSTIIASISRVGQLFLNSQDYASGPRTMMDGAWFNVASATYTDNVTAASGTAPRFIAYAFQRPAVAAANSSVTTTNAATVFIASAPVAGDNMTLTNSYALWVDQGDVRIGGTVFASQGVYIPGGFATTGAAATSLYVGNAPTGATANYAVWVPAGNVRLDGILALNGAATAGAQSGNITMAAGTAATNAGTSTVTIYADTNVGKVRLYAIFPTGAAQLLAQEP